MRIFTTVVFDQIVRGNAEVSSAAEFNELLGKAYDLVFEVEVEESSGTTQTITVKYKWCNSGKGFKDHPVTLLNAASLAALPFRSVVSLAGPFALLGQLGITLGSADAVARVRIWASGLSR